MAKKLPLSSIIVSIILLFLVLPKNSFSQSNWDKLVPQAQKHYNAEQSAELSDLKILKINYLYTKSFYIERNKDNKNAPCELSNIDISKYNDLREQDRSRKIEVSGCKDFVVLLSWHDVEAAYKEIESQNK